MQPSLKLERAPSDWGAEAVSSSQLSREWVSALIRPGAVPCRVRVRADTGQLEMVEEMGLGQLTQVTGSLVHRGVHCLFLYFALWVGEYSTATNWVSFRETRVS